MSSEQWLGGYLGSLGTTRGTSDRGFFGRREGVATAPAAVDGQCYVRLGLLIAHVRRLNLSMMQYCPNPRSHHHFRRTDSRSYPR
jgi:hypothetical protein